VLCKQKNKALVEITLPKDGQHPRARITLSTSKDELQQKLMELIGRGLPAINKYTPSTSRHNSIASRIRRVTSSADRAWVWTPGQQRNRRSM